MLLLGHIFVHIFIIYIHSFHPFYVLLSFIYHFIFHTFATTAHKMTYYSCYALVVNNDYSSFIFNELKTIMHVFSDDGLTSDFMYQ